MAAGKRSAGRRFRPRIRRRSGPRWRAPSAPWKSRVACVKRPGMSLPVARISEISKFENQDVEAQGLALQQALLRKAALPPGAGRLRHHPGGDVQGRRLAGAVHPGGPPGPGDLGGGAGHRARGHAQRAGLRAGGEGAGGGPRGQGLPHHAQGARRGVPDGSPPPVAALHPAERDPPRAPQRREGHPRVLRHERLHAGGRAHLHARRLRGHHHPLRGALLRPGQGVPHPVRPALHGGGGHGARARCTASAPPSAPRRARRAAT